MSMDNERNCYNCGMGTDIDPLRPYGPGGSWVCFDCATDTPEHRAITEAAFLALADAAKAMSPVGMVELGSHNGPQPVMEEDLENDSRD